MPDKKESGPYEDIIHLPRPVSGRHPRMPLADRAAQFLPFAALTGYEAEVKEAARLTDRRIEPSEELRAALDEKLQQLVHALPKQPEASFTCFLPDPFKEGGQYVTVRGRVRRIDSFQRAVLLTDGTRISMEDILDIRCEEDF